MLIGHRKIWERLQSGAVKNKLAHANLFAGPPGIGKKHLVLEFAKWLNCADKKDFACDKCKNCLDIMRLQHPDVFVLQNNESGDKKKEVGIDEVRLLQKSLSLSSYISEYKIAIIDDIADLSREAANSFLKILEEPNEKTLLFLLASQLSRVLPTINSRCQLVKFLPVRNEEMKNEILNLGSKEAVEKAMYYSSGRPGQAIDFLAKPEILEEYEKNMEIFEKLLKSDLAWRFDFVKKMSQNYFEAQKILFQWIFLLRKRFLETEAIESKIKLLPVIREMQKTEQILRNPSLNARLALENLMIKI